MGLVKKLRAGLESELKSMVEELKEDLKATVKLEIEKMFAELKKDLFDKIDSK